MKLGTVFVTNRTQTMQLPVEAHFPDAVKKVAVRVVGHDRILTPVEHTWDAFFLQSPAASDDFMSVRTLDN